MNLKQILPLVMTVVVAAGSIFAVLSSRDAAEAAVVYEPPLEPGPDPFTSPVDVSAASVGAVIPTPTPEPTPTAEATPTGSTVASPQETLSPQPTPTGQASSPGGPTVGPSPIPPGNFGGTGFTTVCDRELLVQQLAANPAAMAAWGSVHNITPDQVPGYIRGLRPSSLSRDSRVTNHSLKNGAAVPFQSIQPAGTAVLIDDAGRIVARCRCGNPLLEPQPVGSGTCKGCPSGYKPPALEPRGKVPPVVVAVNPPAARPPDAPVPTASSTPAGTPTAGGGIGFTNANGRWVFNQVSLVSGPSSCEPDGSDAVATVTQNGSQISFNFEDDETSPQVGGTVQPDGSFDVSYSDTLGSDTYSFRMTGRFAGDQIVDGRATLTGGGEECVFELAGHRKAGA